MVPFSFVCPDLAIAEVRSITVANSAFLPDDTYALLEIYCEELGCDCRRVMLRVVSKRRGREEANISFGFDPNEGSALNPIRAAARKLQPPLPLVARQTCAQNASIS